MAIPLVTDVLAGAAALLGDTAAEQFTSTILLPFYSRAYREAYDLGQRWGLPAVQRYAYAVLPANTTILTPAQAGITDMGEPISVKERAGVRTLAITGVTNATPMVVTTAAHGLADGAPVEITGVVGPVGINNQRWRVDAVLATTVALNGSVAGGAYTSGGTMIIGGEESSNPFLSMESVNEVSGNPDSLLRQWKWMGDTLQFGGSTGAVELRIEYTSSGAAPQSGSVGFDNSQNFLEYRTASLVAPAYDMPDLAQQYKMEALGPSGQADGTGGMLRGLVYPMLREKHKRRSRPQPFRR